jgi:hypothetical protein
MIAAHTAFPECHRTAREDSVITESNRQWLQVGELVANFGGNEVPPVRTLAGRTLTLSYEGGSHERYRFLDGGRLEIGESTHRVVSYRATQLRDGILFVDLLEGETSPHSHSVVLDLTRNICTKVSGALPSREQALVPLFTRVLAKQSLSAVTVRFTHGAIDAAFTSTTARHAATSELVGRRVHHDYGNDHAYEHIYLEPDLYTWHCTRGPEAGLGDTDQCYVYSLADQLYLFVWIEKIIPTIGVLMMDFANPRTTGKLFGYRGADFGATVNSPVGAVSRLLNVTRHDRTQ